MINPFRNQEQIPLETQKQLAYPSGIGGSKIGDSLWKGNAEVINRTIKHIDHFDGIKICDIGCGPGYSLHQLAKVISSGEIIGIDPSIEMCQRAISENREYIDSGLVKIIQGKTPELPLESNYFDYAMLVNVIYFWKKDEVENHLRETYRIIKPSGKLLVYMTTKTSLSKRISESDGIFTFYEKDEVIQLLNKVGFKIIDLTKIKRIIKQTGLIIQATK